MLIISFHIKKKCRSKIILINHYWELASNLAKIIISWFFTNHRTLINQALITTLLLLFRVIKIAHVLITVFRLSDYLCSLIAPYALDLTLSWWRLFTRRLKYFMHKNTTFVFACSLSYWFISRPLKIRCLQVRNIRWLFSITALVRMKLRML